MTEVTDMTDTALLAEQAKASAQLFSLEMERNEQLNRLAEIHGEMARRERVGPEPRISDHAMLRILERFEGLDLEKIRRDILTDRIIDALKAGATAITIDGMRFVVRDRTIVTAVPKPEKRKLPNEGKPEIDDTEEQIMEVYLRE